MATLLLEHRLLAAAPLGNGAGGGYDVCLDSALLQLCH